MRQLVESRLFGRGLFVVSSPAMVARYNTCLAEIGEEPTNLEKFSIDGSGWSPEIAVEKKNNSYLSHGDANQFAIILTPKQKRMPVYYPFNSYTWHLLQDVFKRYMNQIVDITKDSVLWLDFDQALTCYRSPLDLLMIENIAVHAFATNGLMEAAKEQRGLVMKFNQRDDTWFDSLFRDKLLASIKTYGDLRYRSLVIPSVDFNDTRTFHTQAFGGAYVIRDVLASGQQALVILQEDELAKQLGTSIDFLYSIADPNLMDMLSEEKLLTNDLTYYQNNLGLLEIKKELIVVDMLADHRPEVDYSLLSVGQRKKHLQDLEGNFSEEFFQLERLISMIKHGRVPISLEFSPEVSKYIVYPSINLPKMVREVLYHLITRLCPVDIFTLYVYNKRKFFKDYQGWPQGKKSWAINVVSQRYHPRMENEQ